MTLDSMLANEDIAGMREDRLRALVEPFGYKVTRWTFDGGQTIWVETPSGVTIRASAEWGDRFTAPGLAFARLVWAGLIPSGVLEAVVPARY